MDIFAPEYYHSFACIADKCPDSCCKDWCVDVDAQTAAAYRKLPGTLGDRLREVLVDSDDGCTMALENGRCPMWRQDGLCRIQAELGHDALCQTCQVFPRLRHDYGDFVELGLELSCPEAARLILSHSGHNWVQTSLHSGAAKEYDGEAMGTLLRCRKAFLAFLDSTSLSFSQILTVLLLYAYDVQEELDGGAFAELNPMRCLEDAEKFPTEGNFSALQEFFLGLEILTPRWKSRLEAAWKQPQWDARHKALLGYFICRYWLQAVSDFDLICRVKFMIAACLLIGFLGGDLRETAQLFSKEIENDPDNVDTILDGAYTSPALTDLNLLGLLAL